MKISSLVIALFLSACASIPRQPASQYSAPSAATPEVIEVAITLDDFPLMEPQTGTRTSLEVVHDMIDAFKGSGPAVVYAFENGIWETSEGTDEPETSHLRQAVKDWVHAGYALGNHTYDHPDFAQTPLNKEEEEILRNEKYIKKSRSDWKWFRYPFLQEGETQAKRDGLRKFLANHHYKIAQVTLNWDDDSYKDPYTRCMKRGDHAEVEKLKATYLEAARSQLLKADADAKLVFGRPIKHIMLVHSGEFMALIGKDLIRLYKDMGVKFISLDEAARDPIYAQNPNQLGAHDFIWQAAAAKGVTLAPNPKVIARTAMDEICK